MPLAPFMLTTLPIRLNPREGRQRICYKDCSDWTDAMDTLCLSVLLLVAHDILIFLTCRG